MLFEFILFVMAVYKTVVSSSARMRLNGRWSLTAILLHENIVYFFVCVFTPCPLTGGRDSEILLFFITRVGCILVLNNLMVFVSKPSRRQKNQSLVLTLSFECATLVPWFGFGSVSLLSFLPSRHSVSHQTVIVFVDIARFMHRWASQPAVCSSIFGNSLRRIWNWR